MDPVLLNSGMSFDPKEISIDEYWFRKRSEACQILYERLIDIYNSLTPERIQNSVLRLSTPITLLLEISKYSDWENWFHSGSISPQSHSGVLVL